MSHFTEFMSAVAKELGISVADEGSHAVLELDDLAFDFYYDEAVDTLLVVAMVADLGEAVSPQTQALLFKRLIKAQFCFAETTGFAFGLSDDEQFVALQAQWELGTMSERDFLSRFESFVQTAHAWANKLHAELESENAVSDVSDCFTAFNHIRG